MAVDEQCQLSVREASVCAAHTMKILQIGDGVISRSRNAGIVMSGCQKARDGVTQSGYMVSVRFEGIQMGIDPGQLREIWRDGELLFGSSTRIQQGMFDYG